jgi:hypothetical protein
MTRLLRLAEPTETVSAALVTEVRPRATEPLWLATAKAPIAKLEVPKAALRTPNAELLPPVARL